MLDQARFPDADHWAHANFSGVDLGLSACNDRLMYSAACIALQPGASFPTVFTRKDLRCFYSLLHRPEVTHSTLLPVTSHARNRP